MRAVDSSYDQLTLEEAQCLKDSDWPLFIQCLLALPMTGPEQPQWRIPSLRNAQAAHLPIAGYIAIGSSRPGEEYVNLARQGIPDDLWDALKFVAIDVEVPAIDAREVVNAIGEVESFGQNPIIYTSHNIWTNYVTPSNSFALSSLGIPLWNAYWDGDTDVDFARLPFGGWTPEQVALEQWSGGTNICGQFVDRNTIVHPELIGLGEGDHMPTEEYEELTQRITNLLAAGAAGAKSLDKRLDAIEDGSLKVPIWPVGDVSLTMIRHKGYHSPTFIAHLHEAVQEAKRALREHITMHNQSGGAIDRHAGAFIDRMADVLDAMEREVWIAAGWAT
jgi:hypothetical protein